MQPPPLLSSRRASTPRVPRRRVRRRVGGWVLALACPRRSGIGLCAGRTPGSRQAARVLGQPQGHPLAGPPAPGVGELGAVACATPALLGGRGARTQRDHAGRESHGDRRHDQWRRHLDTAHVAGGNTPNSAASPARRRPTAWPSDPTARRSPGVAWSPRRRGPDLGAAATPQNALVVASVTCAGPTDCTALVSNGTSAWSARSTDFGQTWPQKGNLPSSFVPENGLSCLAGGAACRRLHPTSNSHGQGAVAVSGDGGRRGRWLRCRQGSACCRLGVPDDVGLPGGGHDRHHRQRRRPRQG